MNKPDPTIFNTIRLAGIVPESIVDGPGLRMTIFVQGCPHHCDGCHNPGTHDFDGGNEVTVDNVLNTINARYFGLDGITLSGGEPFCQAEQCAYIARVAHCLGLNVWVYMGFTFEELLGRTEAMALLLETDVLVDGRFEILNRTLCTPFIGSSNQRIIDVKKSLERGCAIRYDYRGRIDL